MMIRKIIPTIALAAAVWLSSAAASESSTLDTYTLVRSNAGDSLFAEDGDSSNSLDAITSLVSTPPLILEQNSTDFVNNHPSDHAPLFPLKAEDFLGFFLAALGLILAAGGGIGGGE